MISVQHLRRRDFESGALKEVFPELYALRRVIENTASGVHVQQSAFDHTILVFEGLKSALKSMRLSPSRAKKIRDVLAVQVGAYDSWQLLLLAALLHDLGKKHVLRRKNGITTAVGHEIKSAEMVPSFKFRFGLRARDITYLRRIVRRHTAVWELVESILSDEGNWQKYWRPFKRRFRNHTYGLLLLGYADLLGSSLKQKHKKDFVRRSLWIKRLLSDEGE